MRSLLLAARKVSKSHPLGGLRRSVLEDVNLEVTTAERVSLVGPNGSGKSTLLRIMLGIEIADSGTVESLIPASDRVAYVPQDYRNALFPWLTLRRNLFLPFDEEEDHSFNWIENEYRRLEAGYRIAVDLDKYPYQLSGGEQQIFLLLRAIVSRPRLLIIDEPLSAVDFGRKRLIHQHLAIWLSEQAEMALMVATHDFEEAIMLADRVVLMAREAPRIKAILPIDLDWPRSPSMRNSNAFACALDAITQELV